MSTVAFSGPAQSYSDAATVSVSYQIDVIDQIHVVEESELVMDARQTVKFKWCFLFFKGKVEGTDLSANIMQAVRRNPALTIQLTPGTSIELQNLSTWWKVLPVRTSAFY